MELRTPPPTRPLPSQADIDNMDAEQLLYSERMFRPRAVPVQKQAGVVDPDDMEAFADAQDAAAARDAAEAQAYAQAAAAGAAQAAAAGAAQDAINQAREAAFNRLNQRQKDFIEITNLFTGKKLGEMDFNHYNSGIQLNPQELAEVQQFIYQTAESLAARGAAASGGKRKSKKYHYKKKSKKSKTNNRRRSRSHKRQRHRSNKRSRK